MRERERAKDVMRERAKHEREGAKHEGERVLSMRERAKHEREG